MSHEGISVREVELLDVIQWASNPASQSPVFDQNAADAMVQSAENELATLRMKGKQRHNFTTPLTPTRSFCRE